MRRSWLIVLFVSVLIGTLIVTMPLSFVLDMAGVRKTGVDWQRVEGNIFKGEITGLSHGSQSLGSVTLELRPRELFAARLGYAIEVTGPAIEGAAVLAIGRKTAVLRDVNGSADVGRLIYLVGDIRNVGGSIDISDAEVDLNTSNLKCSGADGLIASNLLDRLAGSLANQSASQLSGNIACVGGALTLLMEGIINQTDPVTLDGVLSAQDRSRVEITVRTQDALLAAGLDRYGFEQNGDDFVIRQEVVTIGGLING